MICYLGTVQDTVFPELQSFDSDSDTDAEFADAEAAALAAAAAANDDDGDGDNGDGDDDEHAVSDEERVRRKLESIRQQIYKLGAYLTTDLRSWRVQLLLAPVPVDAFCLQHSLPPAAVRRWMRAPHVASDATSASSSVAAARASLEIGFGWCDASGRADPFWVLHSAAASSLVLLRSAQRFLVDFAAAHRAFLDTLVELKVGDGADDDGSDDEAAIDEDSFVDAAHEMRRARAAVWVHAHLDEWAARHAPHMHNPLRVDGMYVDDARIAADAKPVSKRQAEREQYLVHLGKKLQHKKGKGKAIKAAKGGGGGGGASGDAEFDSD